MYLYYLERGVLSHINEGSSRNRAEFAYISRGNDQGQTHGYGFATPAMKVEQDSDICKNFNRQGRCPSHIDSYNRSSQITLFARP